MIETENEKQSIPVVNVEFYLSKRENLIFGECYVPSISLDSLYELDNLYCNLAIKSLFNKTNGALIDHKGKVLQKRT